MRSLEADRRSRLRDLPRSDHDDWSLFTGRPSSHFDLGAARAGIAGKRVLVTGAGGFIGSALTRALIPLEPGELTLLDVGELGLHELASSLQSTDARFLSRLVVGSIGDPALVDEVFHHYRPQVIFHAAACKHVPLMEANPFTAAATNALGTQLIVEAAVAAGAEQCILLSTDKAVDPGSMMGATKRIAELILLSQSVPTQMKVLRLGNVFGSSGSVVPLFLRQITMGGPVTVTHPEVTRYFLPVSEAVQHLLSAVVTSASPAVLVADMGKAHHICDLARFLIATYPNPLTEVEIVFTGLRPGDKLVEQMISSREQLAIASTNGLHLVQTSIPSETQMSRCLETIQIAVAKRDLDLLLLAIGTVVPEYHPSGLLRGGSVAGGKVRSV